MKFLPQSYKTFKMNSVFIRLLLGFTGFILLLVLFVGATSYISSSRRLLEEVKKSNMLILKQARNSIDKEIALINDISIKIALNKRVNKAVYITDKEIDFNLDLFNDISAYLNLIKSTSGLSSNIWTASSISPNIWIRFNKSKVVVNSDKMNILLSVL